MNAFSMEPLIPEDLLGYRLERKGFEFRSFPKMSQRHLGISLPQTQAALLIYIYIIIQYVDVSVVAFECCRDVCA